MKQVLISRAGVQLGEVPEPMLEPGALLIRMDHSCISIGTEMSGVKSSGTPILKRLLRQPELVGKVIDVVRNEGLASTRRLVAEKLSTMSPTGYSGAGTVLAVGAGVSGFSPGDRVACAGAQCAYHAEVVRVPRNLVAPVPDGVGLDEASSVALGAIALQGVRRAAPTLGETFVVIGLGILGQMTVQLLHANGCRVIGVDLDRSRLELASRHGMARGLHPDDGDDVQQVARLTGGGGADGVIITAAGASNAIVSAAFRMCRRKARVVLVGDVGLDLQRADIYAKELDFLVSTSYGPGRYDARYEEDGIDYPLPYVRWTEGRNMAEYLRLIADGRIDVKSLISATYPIQQASTAYGALQGGAERPLMVLLSYPQGERESCTRVALAPKARASAAGRIRIAVIGAGGFAKGTHLPNLVEMGDDYSLRAVVSRSGHNAVATGKRFGADYCTTDYREVLEDDGVDAVIVATRHDTHATIALDALRAGKHVLLEKPMALCEDEAAAIEAFYADSTAAKPLLLTGFNRRFSPAIEWIAGHLRTRTNPMIINYRMNAGYIPLDHWVHGREGGGRNRGEACHIYDLFTFLTGAVAERVQAAAITPRTGFYSSSDNFVANISFADGSLAALTYTALGSKDFPKESMELFVDGQVFSLDDYRAAAVAGQPARGFAARGQDKGQRAELQAFARAVRGAADWPIPLWQQLQATRIALQVEAGVGNAAPPANASSS